MNRCTHDPEARLGLAIGMYHCPSCGNMVVAGLPHPDYSPLDTEERPMKIGDLVKIDGHQAIVLMEGTTPEGLVSVGQGNGDRHDYPVGTLEPVPAHTGAANPANFAYLMKDADTPPEPAPDPSLTGVRKDREADRREAAGPPMPAPAAKAGGSKQVEGPQGKFSHESRKP